jgi:ubiquitin-protein ligase
MNTKFADPEDIMNFELILKPDEGFYKGGTFKFSFAINMNFPHEPPKVKCLQKVRTKI